MASATKRIFVVLGTTILGLAVAYGVAISPHHSFAKPESAQGLLDRADSLSWENRWAEARPLYAGAAKLFRQDGEPAKALYAEVSEIPADESMSGAKNILRLTEALSRPEAQAPATRLRILTIRGMIETNYDAGQALTTWREVERTALKQGQIRLASRAGGEQGIAAFILGDTVTAKNKVIKAWGLSEVEHDPAATVRYASIYGAGLVQIHRYKEALMPLDKAISIAAGNSRIAYPTIAIYAKIDALAGLHEYGKALQLADESLKRLEGTPYDGHRTQVLISRGSIERQQGNTAAAVVDFQQAVSISKRIENSRGIVDAGGQLALAYEKQQKLPDALTAIDLAITANTKIPDELYLVPRNFAIKAEIVNKMGQTQQADDLYRKGITLVNRMIQHAPTTGVQRLLLAEMSDVYSGYFATLCSQHRYNEALQILDNVRGRVEAEALQHHETQPVHEATEEDKKLTSLNLSLINTDDPSTRAAISSAIYNTELFMTPSTLAMQSVTHPVGLADLQKTLSPKALLIEYVLAEPASYALAITHDSVRHYQLPSKLQIESDATLYRKEIRSQKVDVAQAQKLFAELLQPIQEYGAKADLIIIPDGSLHLLPFSALQDQKGYVLATHTVDVDPSATVYALLHKRVDETAGSAMPYVGVAAWTQPADNRNPILRAVTGPKRSELVSLPDSKKEVETIAQDLPRPSTLLEGADATETRFKELPLQNTQVIHLALHGYADLDYPERSALIFAPEASGTDDGLLQVREIRQMHLNSKLVTLSACDTGVGPVGETGIVTLVNAFIEAGADSVVSTLWELADQPTSKLMTNFYAELATHSRKVDALRTAQLELLNEGLPPYFWASFQLVGDADGTL
jgi:CHAT domain-containing protein/tetratricopeptide (TPR) repeat protein